MDSMHDINGESDMNMGKRIILVSNMAIDAYLFDVINSIFHKRNLVISLDKLMFGDEMGFSQLHALELDTVIVWLNFSELYPDLFVRMRDDKKEVKATAGRIAETYISYLRQIRDNTNACILWVMFEDYYEMSGGVFGDVYRDPVAIDTINRLMFEALGEDIVFLDLKRIIAKVGIDQAFDLRYRYRWGIPYSKKLMWAVGEAIVKQYDIAHCYSPKCAIIDCDNVLWGGVLSEDGIENLLLGNEGPGRLFQDVQRCLLTLYNAGVILAICSKNDEEDVLHIFKKHTGMILKEDHISSFEINWDRKPANIMKIADSINISLDSIVFIDDSSFEVEEVRTTLPDVKVVLFEKENPFSFMDFFNLDARVDRETVKKRQLSYQNNKKHQQLMQQASSYEEYINSLHIEVFIRVADESMFKRISELSLRTNRMTNGNRFTVAQLKKNVHEGMRLYAVHVSDRLGDLGLVGCVGVLDDRLVLFCLSCRVLGRQIEYKMLDYITQVHEIKGADIFSTGKNYDFVRFLNTRLTLLNATSKNRD